MNEDSNDLYPNASRGPLKDPLKLEPKHKQSKNLLRNRDFSSTTLLVLVIIVALGITVAVTYLIYRQATKPQDSKSIALSIAHEISKRQPTEDYETMKSRTEENLKDCKGNPVVTVTHTYDPSTGRPKEEFSSLEITDNMDTSSFLEKTVERSEEATSNSYSVTCSE